MIPIHDLLNRIRWDANFGKGEFELGYFDRVKNATLLVPFELIDFPADSPNAFDLIDAQGRRHRIPFHRVREVIKDGKRIWHRGEEQHSKEAG